MLAYIHNSLSCLASLYQIMPERFYHNIHFNPTKHSVLFFTHLRFESFCVIIITSMQFSQSIISVPDMFSWNMIMRSNMRRPAYLIVKWSSWSPSWAVSYVDTSCIQGEVRENQMKNVFTSFGTCEIWCICICLAYIWSLEV